MCECAGIAKLFLFSLYHQDDDGKRQKINVGLGRPLLLLVKAPKRNERKKREEAPVAVAIIGETHRESVTLGNNYGCRTPIDRFRKREDP